MRSVERERGQTGAPVRLLRALDATDTELVRGMRRGWGQSAAADWVLAAPYCEKSVIRNVLAYRTARALGRRCT